MPFVALLLNSCASTITPDAVKDTQSSYDSTTPKQYDSKNSGIVGFIPADEDKTMGAIVTRGFRERYNNLVQAYSWQLFDADKVKISQDAGIEYYKDIYGNDLYIIDSEHLAYFLKMNRWNKEGRPNDSVWMKLRNL